MTRRQSNHLIYELILTLYCLFLISTSVQSLKLSSSSILLPYYGNGYPLSIVDASNGKVLQLRDPSQCVQWKCSDPDVIQIQKINCTSAWIRPIIGKQDQPYHHHHHHHKKHVVRVSASLGDKIAECQVFLAELKRIEMATQSKKLTVKLWEVIYLQGRDDDDNQFTTLDGFVIDRWEMDTSEPNTGVVKIIEQVDEWAKLEGEQVGHATVVVTGRFSQQRSHGQVYSTKKQFFVMDQFKIESPCRRILAGTSIQYRVTRVSVQHDRELVIPITEFEPNYQWYVEDENVGTIDSKTGIFTARAIGHTVVYFREKRYNDLNEAMVHVRVVQARSLNLTIQHRQDVEKPGVIPDVYHFDHLIAGNSYRGTFSVLDINNEEVQCWQNSFLIECETTATSSSLITNVQFIPGSSNEITFKTSNDTEEPYEFYFTARLRKKDSITDIAYCPITFKVFLRLKHFPSTLVIPPRQIEQLKPVGGSGKYSLISTSSHLHADNHTMTLFAYQALPTISRELVYLYDANDSDNWLVLEVYVIEPGVPRVIGLCDVLVRSASSNIRDEVCIEIIPQTSTAQLNYTSFQLGLELEETRERDTGVFVWNYHPFTTGIGTSTSSTSHSRTSSSAVGKTGAVTVCFRALKKGVTKFHIIYTSTMFRSGEDLYYSGIGSDSSNSLVSGEFTLGSYEPLKWADDLHSSILTLGLSNNLTVLDGPQPWDVYSELIDKITYPETKLRVSTVRHDHSIARTYNVQCIHTGGHTQLEFSTKHVHHMIDEQNQREHKLVRDISCYHPHHTKMIIHQKGVATLPAVTPGKQSIIYSRTHAELSVQLQVYVRDDTDKKEYVVDNVENLSFRWSVIDTSADASSQKPLATITHTKLNVAHVKIHDQSGQFSIKCEIVGYNNDYFKRFPIEFSADELSYLDNKHLHSIQTIQVANQLALAPSSFLLYVGSLSIDPLSVAGKENCLTFHASGGSGHYEFSYNVTHPSVRLSSTPNSNTAVLSVLSSTIDSMFVSVSVRDKYFVDSVSTSHGLLSIVGLLIIQGESQYVEQDQSIVLTVLPYDRFGYRQFSMDQIELMDIQMYVSSSSVSSFVSALTAPGVGGISAASGRSTSRNDIVSIKKLSCNTFRITGLMKGRVYLVATMRNGLSASSTVESTPFTVTVYEPLSITPSKITVLVGSIYGFTISGGFYHLDKDKRMITLVNDTNGQIVSVLPSSTGTINTLSTSVLSDTHVKYERVKCLKPGIVELRVDRASAYVECVELEGIEVMGCSGNNMILFSGNTVHLSPVGIIPSVTNINSDEKRYLELSQMQSPLLSIRYYSSNHSVLYVDGGASYSNANTHTSISISALHSGNAILSVKATFNHKVFSTHCHVHVHNKLHILEYPSRELILPPNGQYQLDASDHNAKFSFLCADPHLAVISSNGKLMGRGSLGYGSIKVTLSSSSSSSSSSIGSNIRDGTIDEEDIVEQVKIQKFSIELPRYIHTDILSINSNSNSSQLHMSLNTIIELSLIAKNRYGETFANIYGIPLVVDVIPIPSTSQLSEHVVECEIDYDRDVLRLSALSVGTGMIKLYPSNNMDAVPYYFTVTVSPTTTKAATSGVTATLVQSDEIYLHPGDIYQLSETEIVLNVENERILHYDESKRQLEATYDEHVHGISRVFLEGGKFITFRLSRIDTIELSNHRFNNNNNNNNDVRTRTTEVPTVAIRLDVPVNKLYVRLLDVYSHPIPLPLSDAKQQKQVRRQVRISPTVRSDMPDLFDCVLDESNGIVEVKPLSPGVVRHMSNGNAIPRTLELIFDISVMNKPNAGYSVRSIPLTIVLSQQQQQQPAPTTTTTTPTRTAPTPSIPSVPATPTPTPPAPIESTGTSSGFTFFIITLLVGVLSFIVYNSGAGSANISRPIGGTAVSGLGGRMSQPNQFPNGIDGFNQGKRAVVGESGPFKAYRPQVHMKQS